MVARRLPLLGALLLAAFVAGARALPTHAEAGKFGVRIRAERKPDGSAHVEQTDAKTHADYYVVLSPAPDSQVAQSSPLLDRINPANAEVGTPTRTKDGEESPLLNTDGVRDAESDTTKNPNVEETPTKEEKPVEDPTETDKEIRKQEAGTTLSPGWQGTENDDEKKVSLEPIKSETSLKDDVKPSFAGDSPVSENPVKQDSSAQAVASDFESPANDKKPIATQTNSETKTEGASPMNKPDGSKEQPDQLETERVEQAQDPAESNNDIVSPPPVRNAPPEFYMTRKNHAARPHVRPPSGGPDFIAENPLYEWTFPCSSREKSCLEEDRVLYEGDRQCYPLWRSGPCERGQWLVIDKAEALNGSGHFRAVCADLSRCPARQVFMASDRQCHPLSQIIREICPKHEGLQLSYNVFGEGECKCDNCPAPQLPTNTFNEGRCAFPPSFYRAGLEAAAAEAEAETAGAGA